MGKLKELQLQMEENEAMELLVYWTAEGKVVLEAGENALVMHRAEAEALFVDLGHTLQDMDINKYAKESGNGQEQPEYNTVQEEGTA